MVVKCHAKQRRRKSSLAEIFKCMGVNDFECPLTDAIFVP